MKRRFFLLDHSIEDSTGHYLEYAKRVLRAAKLEGFETVLGVNKHAVEIVCPEADIIVNAFSRTFWENQTRSYSKLALGLLKQSCRISGNPNFSRQYAKELRTLFLRTEATAGDIVFVPTLGGTELVGIALYSRFKDTQVFKWHLLFRRDLPIPTHLLDVKARHDLDRVRAAFLEASKRFKKGSISFYTDTEELTKRYNKLGAWTFTTLPIPIDETLSIKKKKQTPPLVISYLGDAREEKGIHLLPDLIATLRSAGFNEKCVRFRIQANLPLSGGTSKAVRAKEKLTSSQKAGVEILEGPFDSDVYHKIISTSDIILIPYCPRSYAARSSGIFTEALAAGVPTIYPAGSWMATCQISSGSVGFNEIAELSSALVRVISNYREHEEKSLAIAGTWRDKHSASNLINRLVKDDQVKRDIEDLLI
jgi:hypothetical protein